MKIRQTTISDAEDYVNTVAEIALVVPVSGSNLNVCRDPDDNILIETAVEGNASHLVSRDSDVARDLELFRYLESQGIRAMTVSQFLSVLSAAAR